MRSGYIGLAAGFGWNLAVSVGVLGYGGWWLDRRFGTEPWLMIAGILSGVVIAFKQLFTALSRLEKEGRPPKE